MDMLNKHCTNFFNGDLKALYDYNEQCYEEAIQLLNELEYIKHEGGKMYLDFEKLNRKFK